MSFFEYFIFESKEIAQVLLLLSIICCTLFVPLFLSFDIYVRVYKRGQYIKVSVNIEVNYTERANAYKVLN